MITSGARPTNSAASLRVRSGSAAGQRMSMRTLRPTAQPNSCKPCRNAARRAWAGASCAPVLISTPMRRIRSGCCAPTATGHAAAAPPSSVMKSRRSIDRIAFGPRQPGPGRITDCRGSVISWLFALRDRKMRDIVKVDDLRKMPPGRGLPYCRSCAGHQSCNHFPAPSPSPRTRARDLAGSRPPGARRC